LDRNTILDIWTLGGLDQAASLYGVQKTDLKLYGDYLGCQNLVYACHSGGRDFILRVSYRADRPLAMVQAEGDFVNFLADHGVLVARALPSIQGSLVETIQVGENTFVVVSFEKARGTRVPDNQYRYREGVSLDEYCRGWGRVLGQMHRLSEQYFPPGGKPVRPDHLIRWSDPRWRRALLESLPVVQEKYQLLLTCLYTLPQERGAYGLIHADFNDGNFCLDYTNGDITVFDFDDACYGWYTYELASAWEGFVGRAMFEPEAGRRRQLMEHYFEQILLGYTQEHILPGYWLDKLPLFLKVIELESLLERLAIYQESRLPVPLDEQQEMDYLVHCIANDIPYLGLFDPVFCHEQPFRLVSR